MPHAVIICLRASTGKNISRLWDMPLHYKKFLPIKITEKSSQRFFPWTQSPFLAFFPVFCDIVTG
jgi:hypothetical protein